MDNSTDNISEEKENENNISGGSKESEGENLDAIKKFIEDQEKEIQELKSVVEDAGKEETRYDKYSIPSGSSKEVQVETPTVIASVMDLILNESEVRIGQNKDFKDEFKQSLSPGDKANNSMSLSVGSKVEAKDFGDVWFSAEVVEVDYEEMEVLVHYKNDFKKHDEWISVSSPRLRPMSDRPVKPKEETVEPVITKEEPKETKPEDKSKVVFTVGEKCLARWRDNRRFVATIHNDLGNGKYEIIFDDGFHWTCNISRLHKYKPSGRYAELSVDTSMHSPGTSAQSPVQCGGPSNPSISQSPPVYHTHLFDPTRDYLGTKSERREMKRKLNIKEIFNIGQKKSKIQKTPKEKPPKVVVEKKPKVIKRTLKLKPETELTIKTEVKTEIPDAVASIIGTIEPVDQNELESLEPKVEVKDEINADGDTPMEVDGDVFDSVDDDNDNLDADISDVKSDIDPVDEEKLEKFDKEDDVAHEEVIDRIKEVINKLEDGLNRDRLSSPMLKISETPKLEKEISKLEIEENPSVEDKETPPETEDIKPKTEVKQDPEEKKENDVATTSTVKEKQKKSLLKMKKSKKLRLLQEKKVKKEVAKVKSQLENWMKKQVEEMRKQMTMETQGFSKGQNKPMPESFMLPGEWCCRWVNGQPVGTVSEMESEVKSDSNGKPALPRRSVQVEDKRLPPGWTKHMVRRSLGHSAGKWDVVLVNPDNRRFHTKTDMRNYLENNGDMELQGYEHALMDFGVHLKLSRRMGWITRTPDGVAETPSTILPPDMVCSTSPLVKRKKLSLKKKGIKDKDKKRRLPIKLKLQRGNSGMQSYHSVISPGVSECSADSTSMPEENTMDSSTLEDGYVYVGSLKVQIIENLLRCPADGCFKNFRNNTLLKMHIKHYHRDLRKMMGSTPKVLDLAYARTMPNESEHTRTKEDHRIIKVKIPRPPKREEPKPETKAYSPELQVDVTPTTPTKAEDSVPRSQDSPKLRHALVNKPVKRPRVLLPVRRLEPEKVVADSMYDADLEQREVPLVDIPMLEPLDFETAISTHTVTKPAERRKKSEKKRTLFATVAKSEEDEWYGMNSDVETMSSFPGSGTPDSKIMDGKMAAASSESNEDQKDAHMYTYTENGERIKIVHMKREEIINCHCGFREEDGLMVQCELCLCWQHALCHNIQKESEVPEKYTCSICVNPWRGRASRRFAHSQERVYEGQLPGARACHSLRRAHELAGNLLRIDDALHALRVKCYVATKKDHPKLYLWAKDWEHAEITYTQEKLNSDYSDLNIMINTIGKENLPVKPEDVRDMQLDMRASPSEEQDDRYTQREGHYGSHSLLSGLLSSPGGSLDLPISTSELERLAKTVQEQECQRVSAPQPEAAIENSACRERLVRHIQRCQALVDARLDSIEAQVAELESQDPSFEDDETADYFPRTKQTIQMLMRDLDTMKELGVIT